MITVSATKLTLYQECRLRYYRKYILEQQESQTTALLFGQAVHTAVEYYYKQITDDPVTVFVQEFDTLLAQCGEGCIVYESPDLLRAIGETGLASFPWHIYQPVFVEHKFVVPLLDDVLLEGRMDIVTEDGFVVDIKTGKRVSSLSTNIQFTVYAYAYEQLFGRPPRGVVWHHFRNHHRITVPTDTLYANIPRVRALAQRLRDDTFENVARCASCLPYCRFYQKK